MWVGLQYLNDAFWTWFYEVRSRSIPVVVVVCFSFTISNFVSAASRRPHHVLGVILKCRRRSKSTGTRSQYASLFGQRPYRLRRSTIGTSYGGVELQWRRLCGCVHEGAMARPWTGNGQFCSAINCNNRRKTCTALSFFRFPVKLLCM